MGVVAASRRGSWYDQTADAGLSVTGYSMPMIFWWGLLLIMLALGERWGLTPVSGRIDLIKFDVEADHGVHADRYVVRPMILLARLSPMRCIIWILPDDRARHHPPGSWWLV